MKKLKTEDDVKELIKDFGYENVLIFSNPDYAGAFIGMSDDNRAVYDFNLMVQHLIEVDDMEEIEAVEFIEYNTLRALPYFGDNAPIIIYSLYPEQ